MDAGDDDGLGIECVESGQGPALIFLPGSYSTPAAWRPVQRLLGPGWRMLTTSLCGYGQTLETRTAQDSGMHHELRLVQHLARRAAQPVHLVGHSFGGTVALAAALLGTIEVASLTLFEANPLDILRASGGQMLYSETLRMSQDFEHAVAAGETDAPARIIDFWGGSGVFAAMPEAVRAYCRATAATNVLDWHCDFGFSVSAAECSRLDTPILLVRGALANAAMVGITDALGANLPNVKRAEVAEAGHFLITSHAKACADLMSSFLAGKN